MTNDANDEANDAPLVVRPLSPACFDAWAALFARACSGCYCRYWHFDGTKNDWLARLAMAPDDNRAEHGRAVASGAAEGGGLVALTGSGEVVGWMKLTPRAAVSKLRKQAVYVRHATGPDEGVFAIGCILVDPEWRRRGVARALLDAAPAYVRARGARAIEAYPRAIPPGTSLHDEQAWMGTTSLFDRHGFRAVAGEAPYPIYRLDLG